MSRRLARGLRLLQYGLAACALLIVCALGAFDAVVLWHWGGVARVVAGGLVALVLVCLWACSAIVIAGLRLGVNAGAVSRRLARGLRLLQYGLAACALLPLGAAFVVGAVAGWLEERTP